MTNNLLEKRIEPYEVGRKDDLIIKKFDYFQSPQKLIRKIESYYKNIKAAGINVPEYLGSKLSNKKEKIITKWSDSGRPLLLNILLMEKIGAIKTLNQVLNFNLWAYFSNLPFSPSLKGFTEKNGKVFYVDFYPPITFDDISKIKGIDGMILSLNLLGLVQKIVVPVREYIALRPELKKDIIEIADVFLYQIGCNEVKKDYHRIFNYQLKKEKTLLQTKNFAGYEKIYYFDPDDKIIAFSPENIWTSHLLYRDLEKINGTKLS